MPQIDPKFKEWLDKLSSRSIWLQEEPVANLFRAVSYHMQSQTVEKTAHFRAMYADTPYYKEKSHD